MPALKTRPLPAVDQNTVLGICQLMHDEKCRQRENCTSRDAHAIDCYEEEVRKILGLQILVTGDAR